MILAALAGLCAGGAFRETADVVGADGVVEALGVLVAAGVVLRVAGISYLRTVLAGVVCAAAASPCPTAIEVILADEAAIETADVARAAAVVVAERAVVAAEVDINDARFLESPARDALPELPSAFEIACEARAALAGIDALGARAKAAALVGITAVVATGAAGEAAIFGDVAHFLRKAAVAATLLAAVLALLLAAA